MAQMYRRRSSVIHALQITKEVDSQEIDQWLRSINVNPKDKLFSVEEGEYLVYESRGSVNPADDIHVYTPEMFNTFFKLN